MTAARAGSGYSIRPAEPGDLALLPEIERSSNALFAEQAPGLIDPDDVTPAEAYAPLLAQGALWVAVDASDGPVGFIAGGDLDGSFYIHELCVHRAHQRRGLGTALLGQAERHARWAFYGAMTLTTDRFLPWNKPFYLAHGFVELSTDRMPAALADKLAAEVRNGLNPTRRCAMAKVL